MTMSDRKPTQNLPAHPNTYDKKLKKLRKQRVWRDGVGLRWCSASEADDLSVEFGTSHLGKIFNPRDE